MFKPPYTVHTTTLSNGCDIAYIDEGRSDTTILFIHGLANYALVWKDNIEYLKQHYRCIALDLPGNGFSGRGDYPYSIDFFSGCVLDFIYKLGLSNVVLAGHSMGGQVAIHLAINGPKIAQQLILCAPAGFETFSSFERSMYHSAIHVADMFSSEENSLAHTIQSSFYKRHPETGQIVQQLTQLLKHYPVKEYRAMVERCIHSMLHESMAERLSEISQSTLVMFGEQDALIPNKMLHPLTSTKQLAETAVKHIPNAKLKMIPQCGHFVQIEKAEHVNRYIHDFLEGRLA